jgi:hypothetical protein
MITIKRTDLLRPPALSYGSRAGKSSNAAGLRRSQERLEEDSTRGVRLTRTVWAGLTGARSAQGG